MRRPVHILIALMATLALAAPALASGPDTPVSVWGSTGLILTPTAHVLGFQEMQLGGGYIGGPNLPYGSFHVGLFQGLEAGINYNLPGAPASLAADFKFRLLKQSAAVPLSLALGGMQLGGNTINPYGLNNQLYMVVGHDLQWTFGAKPVTLARLSLGFGGNLSGAQPMASLQIPVMQYGSIDAEYVGQRGPQEALLNLGLTANPLPWLGVRIASLGSLTQDITTRAWVAGANVTWKIPSSGNIANLFDGKDTPPTAPKSGVPTPPVVSPPPIAHATPAPVRPSPAPTPAVTPIAEGVVQGKVSSGGKGVDRIPLQITGPATRKAWTEPDGSYRFAKAPLGSYKLSIDRTGWKPIVQDVTVVPGTTEVNLSLTPLAATLKGVVSTGQKGVGGVTVGIESLGVVTLTKDDGTYTLTDIPAGTYLITYSIKKKQVDKVTLTLGQGESLQRNLTLSGPDAPVTAKALVRGTITTVAKANLSGVRIMLEGKDLTVMTISGPDGGFVLRELPAGAYKLTVSKQNFLSRFFSLTLKPGQEAKHAIALTAVGK